MISRVQMKDVDVSNPFFDDFKLFYPQFEDWFKRKAEDIVYIANEDSGELVGFLKTKIESPEEDYSDIYPPLSPARRLKICSLKVKRHYNLNYSLGHRLMKLVDNIAAEESVDEIYGTVNVSNPASSLIDRFWFQYGFSRGKHIKKTYDMTEYVYIKRLNNK